MDSLRVLELYSGIGGMHCALKGKPVIGTRNKWLTEVLSITALTVCLAVSHRFVIS